MSQRLKAILFRFVLWVVAGFLLALAPVLDKIVATGAADFTWHALLVATAIAFAAGVAGAIEKYLAPQLADLDALLAPSTSAYVPNDAAMSASQVPARPPELRALRE